jgi:hypothetical protein
MDWTAVLNTLIATLPAILIALGTLLVSLRTKANLQQSNDNNDRMRRELDEKVEKPVDKGESGNENSSKCHSVGDLAVHRGVYGECARAW